VRRAIGLCRQSIRHFFLLIFPDDFGNC
jgi:hypothetical protein